MSSKSFARLLEIGILGKRGIKVWEAGFIEEHLLHVAMARHRLKIGVALVKTVVTYPKLGLIWGVEEGRVSRAVAAVALGHYGIVMLFPRVGREDILSYKL